LGSKRNSWNPNLTKCGDIVYYEVLNIGGGTDMKRFLMVAALLIGFFVLSVSLEMVLTARIMENSGNPLAKNAGRIAKLTEVLRITDDGGDFYFKYPHTLKIGTGGSIYLLDSKQHLKFDKNGKFIINLRKNGEGPGEYVHIENYQVMHDCIYILAYQPPKLIKLDLSGKLVKEIRMKKQDGMLRFLSFFGEKYYHFLTDIDYGKVKTGILQMPQKLKVTTLLDKSTDLGLNMPQSRFLYVNRSGNNVSVWMNDLSHTSVIVENEHSMYISHTSDYLIKHVDMAAGKVLRQFRRKYKPVNFFPKEVEEKERLSKPRKEFNKAKTFFSDINHLALYNDKLLVFTSTIDKEKGVVVDVFGKDGKYLDMVYFPLPGLERPDDLSDRSLKIVGHFLYIVEKDEDDVYSIAKYKITL